MDCLIHFSLRDRKGIQTSSSSTAYRDHFLHHAAVTQRYGRAKLIDLPSAEGIPMDIGSREQRTSCRHPGPIGSPNSQHAATAFRFDLVFGWRRDRETSRQIDPRDRNALPPSKSKPGPRAG